jgi:hypothetical protein
MNTQCSENTYTPTNFNPERYLDINNQLLPTAKLHHGTLLPFGAGIRQCPASRAVEVYFKNFIILTVLYYSTYREELSSLYNLDDQRPKVSSLGFFSSAPTAFDKKEVDHYFELRRKN